MNPLHSGVLDRDPGQLIAAIPALVGFTPTDSIALVTFTGAGALSFHSLLRMDIPAPEYVSEIASRLGAAAGNQDVKLAELVVLDGSGDPVNLPHRPFIEELGDRLADTAVVLAHIIWAPRIAHGVTWQCYEDPECNGPISDPVTFPLQPQRVSPIP